MPLSVRVEAGVPWVAMVWRGVTFLGFRLLATHRRLRSASVSRFVRRSRRQQEAFDALSDRPEEQGLYREHVRRSIRSFNAHALRADAARRSVVLRPEPLPPLVERVYPSFGERGLTALRLARVRVRATAHS